MLKLYFLILAHANKPVHIVAANRHKDDVQFSGFPPRGIVREAAALCGWLYRERGTAPSEKRRWVNRPVKNRDVRDSGISAPPRTVCVCVLVRGISQLAVGSAFVLHERGVEIN